MHSCTYYELITTLHDIPPKWIVTVLNHLLTNHDIKKEKIEQEPPTEITEITIAKSMMGIKEKPRHRYVLTEGGKQKLSYLEWKLSLWKEIHPDTLYFNDAWNRKYYDDMNERIKKQGWKTG
jgi:hypothetical protein